MARRSRVLTVLKAIRSLAAVCMVGALAAGALGYGDETKLIAAAGSGFVGVLTAGALKASHLLS